MKENNFNWRPAKWLCILSIVVMIGLCIGFIGAKYHAAKADTKVILITNIADQIEMQDIQLRLKEIQKAAEREEERYQALRSKYKVPKEFVNQMLTDKSDAIIGWKEASPNTKPQ